jgi:hypothetical protein
MRGWAEGIESRYSDIGIGCSCLFERNCRTPLHHFTSVSKHSSFENRTESAESRGLERNEPFGEEGGFCRLEVRSSNQKSLLILGLITTFSCREAMAATRLAGRKGFELKIRPSTYPPHPTETPVNTAVSRYHPSTPPPSWCSLRSTIPSRSQRRPYAMNFLYNQ